MNPEQLRLLMNLFEAKVSKAEEKYKRKHKSDFDEEKMRRHINNKFKMEIKMLNFCNIMPSFDKVIK